MTWPSRKTSENQTFILKQVFLFQMTGAQCNWSGISHKDSDKVYFD